MLLENYVFFHVQKRNCLSLVLFGVLIGIRKLGRARSEHYGQNVAVGSSHLIIHKF